eukprot:363235-Chlamydomonas_euryale.AAC.11
MMRRVKGVMATRRADEVTASCPGKNRRATRGMAWHDVKAHGIVVLWHCGIRAMKVHGMFVHCMVVHCMAVRRMATHDIERMTSRQQHAAAASTTSSVSWKRRDARRDCMRCHWIGLRDCAGPAPSVQWRPGFRLAEVLLPVKRSYGSTGASKVFNITSSRHPAASLTVHCILSRSFTSLASTARHSGSQYDVMSSACSRCSRHMRWMKLPSAAGGSAPATGDTRAMAAAGDEDDGGAAGLPVLLVRTLLPLVPLSTTLLTLQPLSDGARPDRCARSGHSATGGRRMMKVSARTLVEGFTSVLYPQPRPLHLRTST